MVTLNETRLYKIFGNKTTAAGEKIKGSSLSSRKIIPIQWKSFRRFGTPSRRDGRPYLQTGRQIFPARSCTPIAVKQKMHSDIKYMAAGTVIYKIKYYVMHRCKQMPAIPFNIYCKNNIIITYRRVIKFAHKQKNTTTIGISR